MPGSILGRDLAREQRTGSGSRTRAGVIVRVGTRLSPRAEMRRKPLAFLCFLLSRPSATRYQVLDALWPDNDPPTAARTPCTRQSLSSSDHRALLLRRSLRLSAQDTELIWLDSELIASRSVRCKEQMRTLGRSHRSRRCSRSRRSTGGSSRSTSPTTTGPRSIATRSMPSTSMERAIAFGTAQQAASSGGQSNSKLSLETDASLDQVEASLVKMYRLLGAHAAAAEQYQHYTAVVRGTSSGSSRPLDQM